MGLYGIFLVNETIINNY